MELRQKLESELHQAMRANNEARKRTIRMALANIKNSEIDRGSGLDESGILSILQKEVKSRKESILDAQKANRPDLVEAALVEISILEEFLPTPLDETALREICQSAITELSASGPGDMGKVIKLVMSKVQGRVAGDQVSKIVREVLQK